LQSVRWQREENEVDLAWQAVLSMNLTVGVGVEQELLELMPARQALGLGVQELLQ
jgi:hypothetical protein